MHVMSVDNYRIIEHKKSSFLIYEPTYVLNIFSIRLEKIVNTQVKYFCHILCFLVPSKKGLNLEIYIETYF